MYSVLVVVKCHECGHVRTKCFFRGQNAAMGETQLIADELVNISRWPLIKEVATGCPLQAVHPFLYGIEASTLDITTYPFAVAVERLFVAHVE